MKVTEDSAQIARLYSDIDNIWVGDSGPRKWPFSLLTRVHIERVNFRENIWAFLCAGMKRLKVMNMLKQRRGNLLKMINLQILSLWFFLSYIEARRFFRNLSKTTGIDGFGL